MSFFNKALERVGLAKVNTVRGAHAIQIPHSTRSFVEDVMKASEAVNNVLSGYFHCAVPRHDPYELLAYTDRNGYHSAALYLKVATTVGVGFECSDALRAAIKRANHKQSFQSLLNEWAFDMETFGNGFIEVVNTGGNIAFYRVPALRTRIQLPDTDRGALKILQYVYTAPVHGQKMGFGASIHDFFEPGLERGVRQMSLPAKDGDPFYGEPEYIAVKKLLKLNVSIVDYAEKFFDQALMQDMAIILEGAEFSEEQQEKMKQYITSNFRGNTNAHKILFLTINSGEKIIFHEFNKELLSESFSKFRHDNRDEIISAHRVPPRTVSVLSAGSLGGTGEVEGQLKIYKQTFNDSRQTEYEEQWQQLFADAGLPDPYSFKFKRLDVTSTATDAQSLVQLLGAGILNLQQAQSQVAQDFPLQKQLGGTSAGPSPSRLLLEIENFRKELGRG